MPDYSPKLTRCCRPGAAFIGLRARIAAVAAAFRARLDLRALPACVDLAFESAVPGCPVLYSGAMLEVSLDVAASRVGLGALALQLAAPFMLMCRAWTIGNDPRRRRLRDPRTARAVVDQACVPPASPFFRGEASSGRSQTETAAWQLASEETGGRAGSTVALAPRASACA